MPTTEEKQLTQEILSEDTQDVISKPPSWLVRWGLTLFFSLFIGVFVLMNIITYPDIIPASFRLTSEENPKSIHNKTEGRLIKLLAKNEDIIQKNHILGYVESTVSHEEG